MILIQVSRKTPRVGYIFSLLFKDILKAEFKLTTDQDEYNSFHGAKFFYGKRRNSEGLFFQAADLLFENEIRKQEIEFTEWAGMRALFPVKEGALPFDPFAACFFLVSRYEEYLPHITDRHGRFSPEESVSYKANFLDKPMVNLWALEIKNILLNEYPDLHFEKTSFSFTPTLDIDNAYAYKYKGIIKITFSLLKRLFTFRFKKFCSRLSVHLGVNQDPYDTYDKQEEIHRKYNLSPFYFFLLGDMGRYDRNLSHKNPNLIGLIQRIRSKASVGIHPSYKSSESEEQLMREKERLEQILGEKVTRSRFHYLKFKIPESYRMLINAGIREDYSMGYSGRPGFRAGICVPFYFYDLQKEAATDLKIFPFAVMDSTLKFHMHLRSKDVIPYIENIMEEIKKVGGHFIFIFHNESLGGRREYYDWQDLYEKVIKRALVK